MNYFNYYTEVEDRFVRRRGKHMYVSPLDWSLIQTWKQSGVPLHVVLRGIDIAMDAWFARPRRGTDRLNTLFYCHDAVMREYAAHLESHLGSDEKTAPESSQPAGEGAAGDSPLRKEEVLHFLEARLAEIREVLTKQMECESCLVLERVCARLEQITQDLAVAKTPEFESLDRDLGILDELLVSALEPLVPKEEHAGWDGEARKELKVYKKHLARETYERITANYIRGRIHRRFRIGELSLFHL